MQHEPLTILCAWALASAQGSSESYRFSPVALRYNHTGTTRDCCLFRHPMRLQCFFPASALAFIAFGGSLADDVPAAGWSRQSPGSLGVMKQWRH